MAEKSFFFDAVEENGIPDRVYFSADFAKMFERFFVTGVYPVPSTNLQVIAKNGMNITIKAGGAFIRGRSYENTEDIDVLINASDGAYNRKDIIVVRLDLVNREITTIYKAGIASSNPLAPELIRTEDIWELKLVEIFVGAGSIYVSQSNITDTRLDNSVCGLVDNTIKNVDTRTIFNQYQNYLDTKIEEWNETKKQQELDWQNQMSTQESSYLLQKTEIDGWYQNIKADINNRQAITYEDVKALKGVEANTIFKADGNFEEVARVMLTNKRVADKLTEFLADGNINETSKFYDDSEVLLKTFVKTTIFNQDGSIREDVN